MKSGIFSGKRKSHCNPNQPNTGWFFPFVPTELCPEACRRWAPTGRLPPVSHSFYIFAIYLLIFSQFSCRNLCKRL